MLFVVYLLLNLSNCGANEVLKLADSGRTKQMFSPSETVTIMHIEVEFQFGVLSQYQCIKHLLLLRDDSLELRLELLVGPLEEVDLLAVVLLVRHLLLRRALLYHLARPLQVRYFLQGRGDRVARLIATI